jgi:formamidopyrimidine-DNA glycosylase
MPELPEVETFVRTLRPFVVGQTIIAAQVLWPRTLAEPTVDVFVPRITGQQVQATGRRGKYLLFHLSVDTLIIHLRMSGDMQVRTPMQVHAPAATEKHDRLTLSLSSGSQLTFNDPRKFGRAWLVADPQSVLGGLGPEPLADTFTAADLYHHLQATRRQLKPLLLDQSFLAGVGNIYADESLHAARLHPLTASQSVTPAEADALWKSLRAVLNEGIRRNGASIDWVYRGGDFQNHFQVYRRTGQPCYTCGTPIERVVVGQRSTHFCPQCQPRRL